MKRINLYFILFTAFILITTTIYSIIITQTTFTPEEEQFMESIPTAQPLPMFIVVLCCLIIVLIIGGRNIFRNPKEIIEWHLKI